MFQIVVPLTDDSSDVIYDFYKTGTIAETAICINVFFCKIGSEQ
jgi:hypothetical protein